VKKNAKTNYCFFKKYVYFLFSSVHNSYLLKLKYEPKQFVGLSWPGCDPHSFLYFLFFLLFYKHHKNSLKKKIREKKFLVMLRPSLDPV